MKFYIIFLDDNPTMACQSLTSAKWHSRDYIGSIKILEVVYSTNCPILLPPNYSHGQVVLETIQQSGDLK